MVRRSFIRNITLATGALGLGPFTTKASTLHSEHIMKPKALHKGARIMVISPASAASNEKIDEAIKNIENRGYIAVPSPFLREKNGFLAGTDEQRLSDFHKAWSDETIDGIWCLRGGYGAMRYLPEIDFDIIRRNPKVFIGYSDITALHCAIFKHTGLVTFHGPVGTSDINDFSESGLRIITEPKAYNTIIPTAPEHQENAITDPLYQPYTITSGTGIGRLVGGNLSLISALCGTPSLPSFAGRIIYLEDVSERPYRLDRMLVQVIQATDIDKAAGIVHGVYHDCRQKDSSKQDLHQVIKQTLGKLDVPQYYGLSLGHVDEQITLPNGVYARLDADKQSLTLLENAVIP